MCHDIDDNDSNNGIANHIGQEAIYSGNTISLSYNGSVGEAFYQPKPFWATDDVNVLYFRKENGVAFNKYIALFICAILRQEKYRYSYGRKWVLESMKSTIIKLPEKDGRPNWLYNGKLYKSATVWRQNMRRNLALCRRRLREVQTEKSVEKRIKT